jgi:thiosulfate dehydrogenase
MAARSGSSGRSGGSGFGKFLLGLILGLILVPTAVWLYLRFGQPPVTVSDTAFPFERQLVHIPMHARMDREAPKDAPFGASEDVFEGGAQVYRDNCASCHGTPGHETAFIKTMYPHPPQFWGAHKHGISQDPAGDTYWTVTNGIRLSGMPAFASTLNDTQIWQVSVLLKNADQPLPDPVEKILTQH